MCYLKDSPLLNIICTENMKFTGMSLTTKALLVDIEITVLINFHNLKEQPTILILFKTLQWVSIDEL